MIVLDTNIVYELMRPEPSSRVLRWLAKQPSRELFTTAITQAEVLYGIELLPKGKRRMFLEGAAKGMFEEDFADRILPFDADAARVFPQIAAARQAAGWPVTQFDAQIAAIARSRRAAIATRDTADFEGVGVTVLNPWTGM